MTYEELLAKVNKELELAIFEDVCGDGNNPAVPRALLAVVELHKPKMICIGAASNGYALYQEQCGCGDNYPCRVIKVIEKELT